MDAPYYVINRNIRKDLEWIPVLARVGMRAEATFENAANHHNAELLGLVDYNGAIMERHEESNLLQRLVNDLRVFGIVFV